MYIDLIKDIIYLNLDFVNLNLDIHAIYRGITMSYFSQRLKSLRLAHNYTQKEVAEGVGISQGNYSGLESGKNDPSLTTLQKLSDFYEELIDSLVQPFRVVEDSELSDEELLLLKKLRRLPPEERLEVALIVDMKIDKERKRADTSKNE